MTALEVVVDIHQSRTRKATPPAALSPADKVAVGASCTSSNGDKHGRAMIAAQARPHTYNGDLRLEGGSPAGEALRRRARREQRAPPQ